MTDSKSTLDPRAREDLIGRAGRRLFGPIPKVEFVPPEGSTETEPPEDSEAIRYWTVINGRRQRRHRSSHTALRDHNARRRLKAALIEMLRRTPRRLGAVAGTFAVLWATAAFGSVMLYQAGADYSGSPALSLYFAVFSIWFVLLVGLGALQVKRLFTESCATADLSSDEDVLLVVPVALASSVVPFALFFFVASAAELILSALGVGVY